MKRNVYLVDLGTGSNRNLLPLGIGLITSHCQSIPALNEAFNFHIHFLRGEHGAILDSFERPTVIGFACYVWNVQASLRLAAAAKRRFPEARIVLGGYSVPKQADRIEHFLAEHPQVDALVHGEGEFTFADLMLALLNGRDLATVEGITHRAPGTARGFVTTPARCRIHDLNDVPSPFLNGVFDTLVARHGPQITGAVWETNRGCPFSCTFCDWGNADVNKIKQFSMERLAAEIEWLSRNKIFYIYLADANFGIFLDRDMEIAGRIADACRNSGYPRFMAINWTKNSHERIVAIADRLATGGVTTSVTLAMQSFNTETLAAIKRRNIKQESLLDLKKAFHDRHLPTYTELILGLPNETYASFVDGLNRAMTARLTDHWVFHLCTLLENTEMESDAYRRQYGIEGRVCSAAIARRAFGETDDEEREELVVGTTAMPVAEWKRAYRTGYLTAVLYNFRPAFFVMNYLKEETGTTHTAFVEFVLDAVMEKPEVYPRLHRGVDHLLRQQRMILDGIACLSPIPELGGNMALPHEAVLAILLDDPDAFYADLQGLARGFLNAQSVPVDEELLGDILRYQRARMPLWGREGRERHRFAHNVPQHFDALTRALPPPKLRRTACEIEVAVPTPTAPDRYAFATQRTRSGHTIELLDGTLIGQTLAFPA